MGFQWISWVSLAFNFAVCSIFWKTWVSTSEQSFSAPRRLKTYPTITMKQDRLNSCMLVHCHKTSADTIDPVVIAKTFATANDKGRVEGSSSERWIICLKQEKGTSGRLDWDISFFFYLHTIPPKPTLLWPWKAILCSFCCRYHWRLHPGDTNVSCHLTPSRPSKMLY